MGNESFISNFVSTLKDIKFSGARFLKYQIMAKLIITLMVFPIFKLVLAFIMRESGFVSITNGQLLKFGLSLGGFLGIVLIIFTVIFVILIELGGLIVLCHQCHIRDKESSFIQILKFLFLKIRKLLGVGSIIIIITFLVMVPLIDNGIGMGFPNVKIPGFIKGYILEHTYLKLLFKSFTIIGMSIAILCIFCMHIIILEETTCTNAVKKSFVLVTKNFRLFIKQVFLSILLIAFLVLATMVIYLILGGGVYLLVSNEMKKLTIIILFVILVGVIALLEIIITPIILMQVTKIYYKLNGDVPVINIQTKKSGKVKKVIISFVFLILSIVAFSTYLLIYSEDSKEAIVQNIKTKVTAHRGSSIEAPENTLASLKLAIRHKADFSEFDVQEAKDGAIVVTHDSNFERTAGVNKNLWEMNLDDIKKLDVGTSFNKKFRGEKIPTLQEYIDTAKGKINLNIEIKRHGHEKNLVSSVVKILEQKNFIQSCVVTSLDYDVLQEVERLNPKIKTGYITFVVLGDIENLNIDFYSVEETNITKGFVQKAHKMGRQVHAWTINEEEDIEEMVDLGVDNIITDNDRLAVDKINTNSILEDEVFKFIEQLFKN